MCTNFFLPHFPHKGTSLHSLCYLSDSKRTAPTVVMVTSITLFSVTYVLKDTKDTYMSKCILTQKHAIFVIQLNFSLIESFKIT